MKVLKLGITDAFVTRCDFLFYFMIFSSLVGPTIRECDSFCV